MSTITKRRPATAPRFAKGDWMSAPEWVSVKEAADLAGYDPEYVRRLMRQGKVKASKLSGGREWMIERSSMQAYIKTMQSLGNEKYNAFRTKD